MVQAKPEVLSYQVTFPDGDAKRLGICQPLCYENRQQ